VLGARVAYLAALGPLAPLVGPTAISGSVGAISEQTINALASRFSSPEVICVPLAGEQYGGAVWAVPLWSERGLIGVLLLGDKRDGGLYTQEEIEIARATGERLIDTRASAEMARRLMTLQRQRLAESQVVDQRTRRVLHDDVLPQLHTAMLLLQSIGMDERQKTKDESSDSCAEQLSSADHEPSSFVLRPSSEAISLLSDVHRQIANLLHAMPATAAPELARLGLIDALRQSIDGEFGSAFDGVSWKVEPDAAKAARSVPALTAEVVFYAAREAVRNAARYGRNGEATRALHLSVSVVWRDGLEMAIEDDGVGLGAATITAQGSGHGLGLHGTLMSVVGGTLTAESEPGMFTRISLALPAGAWA
jgi:signal transduction histidine kinase